MRYFIYSGSIINVILVVVLALIFSGEGERSHAFWPRLIWVEFLVLSNWFCLGWFSLVTAPEGRDKKQLAGILPSVWMVIAIYTLLSFFLVVFDIFCNLQTWHYVLQLVILAITVNALIFLRIPYKSASSDTYDLSQGIDSPSELIVRLSQLENYLMSKLQNNNHTSEMANLQDKVKLLREKVNYSLPLYGSIQRDKDYISLARKIISLHEKLNNCNFDENNKMVKYSVLFDDLFNQVNIISDRQKIV
jgi:hypothetical protein